MAKKCQKGSFFMKLGGSKNPDFVCYLGISPVLKKKIGFLTLFWPKTRFSTFFTFFETVVKKRDFWRKMWTSFSSLNSMFCRTFMNLRVPKMTTFKVLKKWYLWPFWSLFCPDAKTYDSGRYSKTSRIRHQNTKRKKRV